jgi:hypothetical protein
MKISLRYNPLCVGVILFLSVFVTLAQDEPMRISEQPQPDLPKDRGTLDVSGTIRLRIEFLADGTIGKIVPVTRIPVSQLTELAIEAARRIKFEPELKEGLPVAVFSTVDYSYGHMQSGWAKPSLAFRNDPQAEAVVAKAINTLGGEKYRTVKSQIGRGKFSVIKDNVVVSFQTFYDVIAYPDKERTEFKGSGSRTIQTNVGDSGWVFDGDQELIKVQTASQIESFKRSIRTSLDNLLRGHWRDEAKLTYVGKRPATLGKRNDVVKLSYDDGFVVEFEFADDGTPQKALYKRIGPDNEEIREEDRYAQFVETNGIRSPFIVDHFTNGVHGSRINYEAIEFNKTIPDSIFAKPANPKDLKKDLKL